MTLPNALLLAMETVAKRTYSISAPWLIGGSCGLSLQDVPVQSVPRDLDIYIDASGACEFHKALLDYAVDDQQYSETDRYRSTLSHYAIHGMTVELVAGFEVRAPGATYRIDIEHTMRPLAVKTVIMGADVGLMPLSHELLFNLLRDRPDRYEAIADTMRADLPTHLPALQAIMSDNQWNDVWLNRIYEQLCLESSHQSTAGEGAVCRE